MTKSVGYSGKPLFQKLGFKPGFQVLTRDIPDTYADLMVGVEDVLFHTTGQGPFDAAHVFLRDPDFRQSDIQPLLNLLKPGGMLWLSWVKKSSKRHNGITEDILRTKVLPLGWVDVKVCAVDADWSGLKFLRRKTT